MRSPPQILIIDDNPANLDIFETRLAAHEPKIQHPLASLGFRRSGEHVSLCPEFP